MIAFAIDPAEGHREGPGVLVEVNHVGAAETVQSAERGRLREGKKLHTDKPPAQAQPDEERREAALGANVAQGKDGLLKVGVQQFPVLTALVPGPADKDPGIVGYHVAIVDSQLNALPLHLLELLRGQASP